MASIYSVAGCRTPKKEEAYVSMSQVYYKPRMIEYSQAEREERFEKTKKMVAEGRRSKARSMGIPSMIPKADYRPLIVPESEEERQARFQKTRDMVEEARRYKAEMEDQALNDIDMREGKILKDDEAEKQEDALNNNMTEGKIMKDNKPRHKRRTRLNIDDEKVFNDMDYIDGWFKRLDTAKLIEEVRQKHREQAISQSQKK